MDKWLYLEPLRECLADYLRQRGLSTRKSFRCLNSQHEDKRPSMSYNSRVKNVHCFSCGVNYDLFDLIGMDYGITDFAGQYHKACALFGFLTDTSSITPVNSLVNVKTNIQHKKREPLVERDLSKVLAVLEQSSDGGYDYYAARGITAETCKKRHFFERDGRAYMPVFLRGKCAGWTARSISDGLTPRYKNSVGSIGIWNADLLLENGGNMNLFVTEGIIDAATLEQLGEKAIALCGSQNKFKLLRFCEENMATASTWRFVLAGDSDDSGAQMNAALHEGLQKLGFPVTKLSMPQNNIDINALYLQNADKLKDLISSVGEQVGIESAMYAATSAAAALDTFFAELERRAGKSAISTGFEGLDKLLDGGLHAGLYVLGAISSLGKTSFLLQIADYIAENECDVLFFSLEQSRYELMAKSISRTSATLDSGLCCNAFTARQILSGAAANSAQREHLLLDARDVYAKSAAGLFIREGMADIGTGEIRAAVREHITMRKTKPVVIVDYLQILAPSDRRATDKQNTDRAVVDLKRISRDFDIPVFAVSSFNRENYRTAVSMEAFKESGAVEYSADTLFGIQLEGAGEQGFDVNAAKSREPRQVELVILKNRNGIPYAKLNFKYDARFSLFEEITLSPAKKKYQKESLTRNI